MTYTYRKSAFTKTETITIGDTDIFVYNEKNMLVDTISYDEIKSISMVNTPTKVAKNMHQCTIKTNNHKKVVLRNYSYQSLANFKDQTESYLVLINELHHKIRNKDIQFKKGINKKGFWAMLTFLILMNILMGVVTYVLYTKSDYAEMGVSVFAVVLVVVKTLTYVVSFKPEVYDPNNIPVNALP